MEKQIKLAIEFNSCPSVKELKKVLKAIPNATFKSLRIWEEVPFTPEEVVHRTISKLMEENNDIDIIDVDTIMSCFEMLVILSGRDGKLKIVDWKNTPEEILLDTVVDAIIYNINLYYEETNQSKLKINY